MSQQPAQVTPGASAPAPPMAASDRIWTIPNVISFVRLLGVPVFLYLLLGPQHDVAAVIVLMAGGTTDWVDGYVARRMGSVSRLGELLDPFADRLYIVATLVGLTVREIVPWWLAAALLLREAVMAVALLVLRRRGFGPPPVHYVGKTGTFVLLGALPLLLLAAAVPSIDAVVAPIGWGLAWWALGLYWAAAVLYLAQIRAMLRSDLPRDGAGLSRDSAGLSRDGVTLRRDSAGPFRDGAALPGDREGTSPDGAGPSRDGAALPADGAGTSRDGVARPHDGVAG